MTCIVFLPSYNTGFPFPPPQFIIRKFGSRVIILQMLDMVCMEIILKMEDSGREGAILCVGSSYIQVHAIKKKGRGGL